MSLIEQLGGYEKAKWWEYHLIQAEKKGVHHTGGNSALLFTLKKLQSELLKYRHQHNIFEVGDWFVSDTVLKPFKIVERDGDYLKLRSKEHTIEFSGNAETIIAIFRNPRHATIEEIESGRKYG